MEEDEDDARSKTLLGGAEGFHVSVNQLDSTSSRGVKED